MRRPRSEAGIALLISIFILLLISVVAIALIVASGTESALAGNYRSSTGVYYAAYAGLEEARSRLRPKDPNSFASTWSTFYPPPGATLPLGRVGYVLNPSPTDNPGTNTTYPDTEYDQEFGTGSLAGATVLTISSVWNKSPLNTLSFPGPLYKWVRINAVTEKSTGIDADGDGHADDTTQPLFYNGAQFTLTASGNSQVFELTSLAVLPNGSQKLVQTLVTSLPLSLSFPSALTLDGSSAVFNVTNSANFFVKGNDQYPQGTCTPGTGTVTSLGFTGGTSADFEQPSNPNGIVMSPPASSRAGNYTNMVAPTPNLGPVTVPPNMQTVGALNLLVQTIEQNADVPVISGKGVLSDTGGAGTDFMPAAMSATNPMTIVVNDDLPINGWHRHGYGLLLVTGELTYDPDTYWHGIILVIGKGYFHSSQGSNTGGHFEGALFIARTQTGSGSSSGTPLAPSAGPGVADFDFTSTSLNPNGSNYYGVYYSSCWIQAATPTLSYKVLSFHEIAQ